MRYSSVASRGYDGEYQIDIEEIEVVACRECGRIMDECMCCKVCDHYPCKCCPTCNSYPCICCLRCLQHPCICIEPCELCGYNPCVCDLICPVCHELECTCEPCVYCGEMYCLGACQTCHWQCGTPYCYGECKEEQENNEPQKCKNGVCDISGGKSCECKEEEEEGEEKQMCKHGNCDLSNGGKCICIPVPCDDLTQEGILDASTNHEGGFVDHPDDPGGATNRGIAWDTWQANAMPILGIEPTLGNLKSLTIEDAKTIYIEKYWNKARIDEIDDPDMRYAVFDFYINSPSGAGKAIQRAVNELSNEDVLKVDGVIGPKTIEELNKMNHKDVYNLFLDNRKLHYHNVVKKRPTQEKFLNGWLNRTNKFRLKTSTQVYNVNC